MQTIYIVSYMNKNDTESIVTAFDNEKVANKVYNYFNDKYNINVVLNIFAPNI